MLKNTLLIAAVTAALGACSAAAQRSNAAIELAPAPAAVEAAAPVAAPAAYEAAVATCDIRVRNTENGVRIQGRAFADTDIDGEYELTITTSGANQSEISQAGPVSLVAGRSATFGESEISLGRGSRLRAVLTLSDADGRICRDSLTL
jgi:hypothetical protein